MIKIYQLVTTYFFQTIIDMVYSSLHDVGVFHAASKAMMLQCLEITLLIEACMHDIRFNCAPIYIDTGILIICPYRPYMPIFYDCMLSYFQGLLLIRWPVMVMPP